MSGSRYSVLINHLRGHHLQQLPMGPSSSSVTDGAIIIIIIISYLWGRHHHHQLSMGPSSSSFTYGAIIISYLWGCHHHQLPMGPSSSSSSGWSAMCLNIGKRKAMVLPLPVLAIPIKSRPDMMAGMAWAWIGVGLSNIALKQHMRDDT